jgi:hypothetical protein
VASGRAVLKRGSGGVPGQPGVAKAQLYRRYGLSISSDGLEFGPALPTSTGLAPDLRVRWRPQKQMPGSQDPPGYLLARRLGADGRPVLTLVASCDGYLLRLRGVADLAFDREVTNVVCKPGPGATEGLARDLVRSTILTFVLALRGKFLMHASAVVSEEGALVIAGPPASGKTTLAALLCAGGGKLLADDLLCIDRDRRVIGTGPRPALRLRPATTGVLDLFPVRPESFGTSDGRTAFTPSSCAEESAVMCGIVLPQPTPSDGGLRVERVGGSNAVVGLASAARIASWVDGARQERFFDDVVQLAEQIPIWRVWSTWGPPFAALPPNRLLEVMAACPSSGHEQ